MIHMQEIQRDFISFQVLDFNKVNLTNLDIPVVDKLRKIEHKSHFVFHHF